MQHVKIGAMRFMKMLQTLKFRLKMLNFVNAPDLMTKSFSKAMKTSEQQARGSTQTSETGTVADDSTNPSFS